MGELRHWRRRERESPYLSRRVKLTAVHFLFVLPVWLNIISSDETTWTPFVWETMDRNNTQSLLGGADTDTDHHFHAPRYVLFSLSIDERILGAGKRLGWILATNIFFHLADLSLNFAKMHSPPLGRFFSQIMIYTWFIRVIIEFYFISHPPRNRLLYSILPKLIDRRIT